MSGPALPLAGRRVVVTRPPHKAAGMAEALRELGAEPLLCPAIRLAPPADAAPLERAARALAAYDWVVFTSANGVAALWDRLPAAWPQPAPRCACIGPATAGALRQRGVEPALVAGEHVAEGLARALRARVELPGARVLLPVAAGARDVLPDELTAAGAHVDRVEAYRTVPDAQGAQALARRLEAGDVDVVTFTSSSAVRAFVDAVGTELGGALVAVIGPVTARTAREAGLPVAIEAGEHSESGLIGAVVEHYTRTGNDR